MEHKSSEAHLAAVRKYDAEHTARISVKARKETIEEFKTIAARRGEKVNTLLRNFIIDYVNKYRED